MHITAFALRTNSFGKKLWLFSFQWWS